MPITNYQLKKKLAHVTRESRYMNLQNANSQQQTLEQEGTVLLTNRKITKIQGEYVITEDGKKAKLYSPIPCLHWKCTIPPDKNGTSTLRKSLDGLFIDDGVTLYCLGVSGTSEEFEIRLQVGTDEIRLNNLFLNVNTQHLVVNGLEEKRG